MEQDLLTFRADALAGIADTDFEVGTLDKTGNSDLAFFGEFHGVAYEVVDDLFDSVGVSVDLGGLAESGIEGEFEFFLATETTHLVDNFLDYGLDSEGLGSELHFVLLESGGIEEVVDDFDETDS